jgi:hypothetical protein
LIIERQNSMDLVFISIAAYRDPQLIPTIEDCLSKALHPEYLRFGICWQHAVDELPLPYVNDERFRILDIAWRESQGACWARAEAMKVWRGEPWFLQVDSHCRFAGGWDDKLVRMMGQTESPKPILSTYATPFTPGENEILEGVPLQMAFQGFTADGIPHMRPVAIRNWHSLHRPLRARFVSGGFLFAPGGLVREVPYDPELYFLGEEAAMTLRAFTHGYDLFHPCETIVWHDYVRKDAVKHWDDHTEANKTGVEWRAQDLRSKNKIRKLLSGGPLGAFGLGSARTIEEFENMPGYRFAFARLRITRFDRRNRPIQKQMRTGLRKSTPGWCESDSIRVSFRQMVHVISRFGTSECMTRTVRRSTVAIFRPRNLNLSRCSSRRLS